MIGKIISHYRITEKLGEGGMGVVYKALDTTLDRHVAIKFLPPHLRSDEQAKTRFVHEAKAASALNHANIAVVHEIGETPDGQMFIVMAYYEGQTLKAKLEGGPLDVDDAISIVSQLASGLGKAHEKKILHRDIKPANILMGDDGHAKLADFGLAKLAGRTQMTKTGSTLGTVSYMSPEQASGGDVDHRSDIFSLGVVFYELITGKLPFPGDHEAAVLYGIMNSAPTPLASHRGDLPPQFQTIVERVLSKDPAKRYQTADELLDDLKALGSGGAISGSHTKRQQSSTTRVALWLAVMALLVAGGIAGYQQFKDSPQPDQPLGHDEPLVIVVAPFWGQNTEALEEGKVMQALVERRLVEELGEEETVTVLGKKDAVEAPQSNDDAKALGEKLGAIIVIWGEVLVLRGEVEIQPYLTVVKWFHYAQDWSTEGMQVSVDGPNQLSLRKAKAEDVGQVALQAAGNFYRSKDPDRALELLQKITPPTTESLMGQGLVLISRGEWNKSEVLFERAIDLDPDNAWPYWGVAFVNSKRGDIDGAIQWYQKSIEVDSTFQDAYAGMSTVLLRHGKYNEATQWIENALALFPRSYWAYVNLAWINYLQERYDDARRWIDMAIEVADNPTSLGNAYHSLGFFLRAQGQHDEAQRWYKKALELDPEASRPYFSIGNINFEKQEYEEAVQWYERGAQLNWGGVNIQYAISYMMLDRYVEAAEVLRRLVQMHPRDLNSVLMYAICLHWIGEKEKANEQVAMGAKDLDGGEWIAPVVSFYSGEIKEEEVFIMAEAEDPQQSNGQKCQAHYYLGMAQLLGIPDGVQPDTTAAMVYFEKCVATGEETIWEFRLARRMLEAR
jgi:tetratricopeptide (TPR) repeat protein